MDVYSDSILSIFGSKVKLIRKKKQLSQKKLGENISLHYSYVGSVERGERNIGLVNIDKLAKGLNISIRDFFDGAI